MAQDPGSAPRSAAPRSAAPRLAVSTVIFTLRSDDGAAPALWTPFVRRTRDPFLDQWALPGGWLPDAEPLEDEAARTLAETTGLRPSYLEQLYTFGAVDRSPTGRVISVVYWALVRSDEAAEAAVGHNVRWFPADDLPDLAFDHNAIVNYALQRLRTKVEYAHIAHTLLGETFTLAQLRAVHEAVRGHPLDPANFRRSITASAEIVETGERLAGTPHRPPKLYRYRQFSPGSASPTPTEQTRTLT
ncbi:MAG TPA: NUDIX domain-containing protein [Citricoccus sp.]